MKTTRAVFGKWGARPHWAYDALHLGDDAHPTLLGPPTGTGVAARAPGFATVAAVDLDLDVVRGRSGRVWGDEDELAENRVRLGHPDEVVELAVDTREGPRRAVLMSEAPFDDPTAQRWLQGLDESMMLR